MWDIGLKLVLYTYYDLSIYICNCFTFYEYFPIYTNVYIYIWKMIENLEWRKRHGHNRTGEQGGKNKLRWAWKKGDFKQPYQILEYPRLSE